MKTMAKIILFVAAVSMIAVLPCFADGRAFKGKDFGSMRSIAQNEQRAVISHKDGIEKMLIAISLEMENEDNAIWIFPVPGKPEKVKVDVLDSFPRFSGKDPLIEAYKVLTGIRMFSMMTQIYPFFTCLPLSKARSGGKETSEISIHESIEKWGIRAETITAQSQEALSDYLTAKKVGLGKEELKPFERYLGGDYVLVVIWIDSRTQLLKQFPEYTSKGPSDLGRWPCLYVEFPTEKAFYPLLATSAYGETEIPINIVVLGYVAQDANSKPAVNFRQRYYKQSQRLEKVPAQLADVMPRRDIRYTRLRFRGPAKDLTEDLWLKPTSPPGIWFAEIILPAADNPFVFFVPLLCYIGILSYLSAGIAGWILYRKWRGFGLLGLFNVFTIVAIYFAARWARNLLAGQIQNSGKDFSVGMFITVFSIIFVLLDCLLIWLIWGWAVFLVGA
jgi:hypothetical protein